MENDASKRVSSLTRFLDILIVIVGCSMVLYHMAATQFLLLNEFIHQNVHLGFALALATLAGIRSARSGWARTLAGLILIASLSVTAYVFVFFDDMMVMVGLPDQPTTIMGIVLIVVVVLACWYAWGPILPTLGMTAVAYFLWGQVLPDPLFHMPFETGFIVSTLGVGFTGIFGSLLNASANEIYLFIVFGGLLQATGAHHFFLQVGRLAGRWLAGGPAHTAVVGSGLVGMVTGAAMANVAITGSFTIPLMKRVGYRKDTAGAIEAVASAGGQVMPPIMGASAFLMAAILGIPYIEIVIAGIMPALLYYGVVAVAVQIIAKKEKIPPVVDKPDMRVLLARGPLFVIPLATLTVLLFMRFSPAFSAFWTIVLMVVLAYLRRDTRPKAIEIAKGAADGAIAGGKIAVAIACVSLVSQTLTTTGLGLTISGIVEALSGGNIIIALFLTMALSLLLGIGVPTMAAYALVAVVVAPVLVRMDITPLAAHYFAFYCAVYSCITPPCAMASLAACSISGGGFWRTSAEAFRLGFSGLVIPFLVIFNPVLVLRPLDPVWGALSLVAIPLGLLILAILVYNYFFTRLTVLEWLWFALASAGLFGYGFTKEYTLFGIGLLAFVTATWWHWRRSRLISKQALVGELSG